MIKIICARHLPKVVRGYTSPFVEVEISGVAKDNATYVTETAVDNGLCPVWNEEMQFDISVPEMACIRVVVQEKDMFGDPRTVGQACFFIGSREQPMIRSGEDLVLVIGINCLLPFTLIFRIFAFIRLYIYYFFIFIGMSRMLSISSHNLGLLSHFRTA